MIAFAGTSRFRPRLNSDSEAPFMESSDCRPALAYTVEETAQLLRVGRTTVFFLIKSRQLSSLTIGRSRRISATALAEFIAQCESNSKGNADEIA
jgi:excisionase family DNA binding protein